MNISKVQAQLTGEDILSILKEFVKIKGLNLDQVIIDNVIKIKGEYSKKINVKFEVEIEMQGIQEGKVHGKISKLKAINLGFFRPIRSLALKMALKNLTLKGIKANKDKIEVDIEKLLIDVPFVKISISDLFVKGELLHVEVEEINISLKGQLIKVPEEEELEKEEVILTSIIKVEDGYTLGRKSVEDRLSQKVRKISDYLFIVPDVVALIYRLLKDKRVKVKTKVSISLSLAYVVLPIDIIPDKIPIIGKIDDVAIIFFALNRIANDIPLNIILENWQGKNELIVVMKSGLDYIINFTGARNVEKLYNIVEELRLL